MKFVQHAVVVIVALLVAATTSFAQKSSIRSTDPVFNRTPLAPNHFAPVPLGSVKAKGWLEHQLRLMAVGMAGELDRIYPNVGELNAWRGGPGDAWERGPYWLDGLVPLAYILGDERLIEKAKPYIEWTLNSQQESGFFGPEDTQEGLSEPMPGHQTENRADWWPRMVMLKVLQNYYEATGDERVIDLMTDYFRYQQKMLPEQPLDHWTHWSKTRGGENQASIYWLYNRTGEDFLLDLAPVVFEQTRDWTGRLSGDFAAWHGVNTAMGLKQPAIQFMQARDSMFLHAIDEGLRWLMDEHGQVQGLFSGDELLHGTDPVHGTELCTVVELMYSLEMLAGQTGRLDYVDQLERVAYNALPAQITADYMGRQYFQQPNQVRLSKEADRERNFITNHDGKTNLYGLVNGYPCCTTNMHQGWPKLVQHAWYATPDGGLAAMVHAPTEVAATVGDGQAVRVEAQTKYPFEEQVRFVVHTDNDVRFPLHLRVPAWADGARVLIDGEEVDAPDAGTMAVVERTWQDGDVVTLELPMDIRTSRWHERSVAVERGPLVYALKVDGAWQELEQEYGVPTWEVAPTSPWNYGLAIDWQNLEETFRVEEGGPMADQPWTADAVPIRIVAKARRIPTWKEYNGSAGPIPHSRARTSEPVEEVTLIPYGATVLRISEFPVVRDE